MIAAPARVDRNPAGTPVCAFALCPVPIAALPDWIKRLRWIGQAR